MLRPNAVRARLDAGGVVHGLICSVPAPALVEMIGCAGYDFVVLDTEHTGVDPQRLEDMIRAAEAVDLTPWVRVPERDPGAVLRALDAGAMGIVQIVPMIEDAEGVEAIDDVLAVDGVDLVLEGAADLSQSYGVPWQTRHPRVTAALEHVAERCAAHGVPFCAIPRTPEDHAAWRARGVRAFVLGDERGIAARALRAHLRAHREEQP